jgi:hypothetical protein
MGKEHQSGSQKKFFEDLVAAEKEAQVAET